MEPELDWLPLEPLEPLLPPLVCWDGNGDWLPLPDWLWVLPGLPPDEDGVDEGEELGVEGIEGIDGMDVCVEVVVEQPARAVAQAMGQKRPWTLGSRMIARVSRGARGVRLPDSAGHAQPL